MEITTDDPDLRNQRLEHLAPILAGHPHVCLSCPEADGCTRDECTYGNPPEARCCEMFGWCELGRLVDFVDSARSLPRRPVAVARAAVVEGRIRLEWGLCVGCGRCVLMCGTAEPAGQALEMTGGGLWAGAVTARTRKDSLRTSGCTFCGLCVLVCPAGALSAPGEEGARWLAGRRERFRPADQVLPPQVLRAFDPASLDAVPRDPGVFELTDLQGQVVTIKGVADLREGLAQALTDPACGGAAFFRLELDPLFTQRESELLARYAREHGHLPPASGFDDDLFADD
ncbi:MAG: hypothetical protein A2133_10800 [Actinobacteria bacterium RBG_16_64_13]|nr:MAG: hypothetical protein A2133_10800 [Actinobacteria bacterium RBG_16_64_13]